MAHLGQGVSETRSVAVIGGGWAGCAAAASLAAAGMPVTLFEAAAELGGRGRRIQLQLGDRIHKLDNGQHLMIGAYSEIARLLASMGVELDQVVEQRPFELSYPDGFRLAASRLPAPWHLVSALLRAQGLPWHDRVGLARFLRRLSAHGWRVSPDREALAWLEANDQGALLVARIWRPLCVAALNTDPAAASAQLFAHVLRDTLGATSAASMLWLPRCDLSTLLPEAAERFVVAHGGMVRRKDRVEQVDRSGERFVLRTADGSAVEFDAVVYAAAPTYLRRIATALAGPLQEALGTIEGFEYEPICTVYLKYTPDVTLPRGFSALVEDPANGACGQWAFDRGTSNPENRGVLAIVVSASGPHLEEGLPALCAGVARQLTEQMGLPAPQAARAVVEKRATLAARPGLRRPRNATAIPGFVLAGDWTHSDYPSTLESAVRSGVAAARHLLA